MDVRVQSEILSVIETLCRNKDIKVAIEESVIGATIIGGAALTGSLLGGPVGLVVGSLIGSGVAFIRGHDKYDSVPYIIKNKMTEKEKRSLTKSVHNAVKYLNVTDATILLGMIMATPELEEKVMNVITTSFNNLGYKFILH